MAPWNVPPSHWPPPRSVCAAAKVPGLGSSCRRIARVPFARPLRSDYRKRHFRLLGDACLRGCRAGNRHIAGKFLRSHYEEVG